MNRLAISDSRDADLLSIILVHGVINALTGPRPRSSVPSPQQTDEGVIQFCCDLSPCRINAYEKQAVLRLIRNPGGLLSSSGAAPQQISPYSPTGTRAALFATSHRSRGAGHQTSCFFPTLAQQ